MKKTASSRDKELRKEFNKVVGSDGKNGDACAAGMYVGRRGFCSKSFRADVCALLPLLSSPEDGDPPFESGGYNDEVLSGVLIGATDAAMEMFVGYIGDSEDIPVFTNSEKAKIRAVFNAANKRAHKTYVTRINKSN